MMSDVPERLRVAYTLEQCWHRVPGGTAVAALEVARRLVTRGDIELAGVAGRHRHPPDPPYVPAVAVHSLPIARPWLYEAWNRLRWPAVEKATGQVDVCHSTTAIPAVTSAPHVVTIHDVAFLADPDRFTRHGVRVMRAGLERCRAADLVLCPSSATRDDLVDNGFDDDRIRVVPWGVTPIAVAASERDSVRARYALPERYALFVGTIEPRKNLARLAAAVGGLAERLPLVVAGTSGWGDSPDVGEADVRFLGFVPDPDLPRLYSAAAVFVYPSLREGFGLPIAEAMSQGVPVVTSAGGATEEIAGGAAVLVDPTDVSSIGAGIAEALSASEALAERGRARVAELSWETTVARTVAAYREIAR